MLWNRKMQQRRHFGSQRCSFSPCPENRLHSQDDHVLAKRKVLLSLPAHPADRTLSRPVLGNGAPPAAHDRVVEILTGLYVHLVGSADAATRRTLEVDP